MRKNTINSLLAFVLGFLIASIIFYDLNLKPEEKVVVKEIVKEIPNSEILKGHAKIVAVNNKGEGLIGEVEVEITDGNGNVLINTNPFIEPDTQYSANIAVDVAKNLTKVDLSNKNVIFNYKIGLMENETGLIGGPSAGASMTLAVISAIREIEPKEDTVVSGAILPDGSIGWVGGIVEKGQAAVDNNISRFVVPEGQTIVKYYEPDVREKKVGKFVFKSVRYSVKTLDIVDYFNEQNLEVKEAKDINDLIAYTF